MIRAIVLHRLAVFEGNTSNSSLICSGPLIRRQVFAASSISLNARHTKAGRDTQLRVRVVRWRACDGLIRARQKHRLFGVASLHEAGENFARSDIPFHKFGNGAINISSVKILKRIRLYTSRSPRRCARKNAFTFNDVALRL